MIRFLFGIIIGGLIGIGVALWYQGEPPFVRDTTPQHTARADVTLVLSDAYLSRKVAPVIYSQSRTVVRAARVTTRPGNTVFLEGKAYPIGIGIPVGVELRPVVHGAAIAVQIIVAHIGPIPIPGIFTGPLQDVINRSISGETAGPQFRIVGVRTTTSAIEVLIDERRR